MQSHDTIQTKECSSCRKIKPLTDFMTDIRYRLGVRGQCRKCMRAVAHVRTERRRLKEPAAQKKCPTCGVVKPRSEFYSAPNEADGLRWQCRMCQTTAHWSQSAEKRQARSLHSWAAFLKCTYSMTPDQYRALLIAQNYSCAICGNQPKRRLVIDHCHKTGRIRGLLCFRCNLNLSGVERDGWLPRALAYLSQP